MERSSVFPVVAVLLVVPALFQGCGTASDPAPGDPASDHVGTVATTRQAFIGGSASQADSCYSDCGGASKNSTGSIVCWCDTACELRGDCCQDKHEYCAPQAGEPLCSLTSNSTFSNFCGTDLGFAFEHKSKIEVLFGDTWEWNPAHTACFDPGAATADGWPAFDNDDSQGTLPVARPSWVPTTAFSVKDAPLGICQAGTLALDRTPATGSTYTFKRIELRNPPFSPIPMIPGNTPLTGFSDGTTAFAVIGEGGSLGFPRQVHIAERSTTDRTVYSPRASLGETQRFANPSAVRVTSLTNFDPPPSGTPGVLLMFGRPRFTTSGSQTVDTNGMYLMYQDLPFTASTWKPKYLKGWTSSGGPDWADSAAGATENSAVPMLANDFKVLNQIEIKWIKEIRKWVMLYGGGMEWYMGPPANDQPRHGAIHMRMADYPWGPWSRPTPVLWRETMGAYLKCDSTRSSSPAGCDHCPTTSCGADNICTPTECSSAAYPPGDWMQSISSDVPGCDHSLTEPVQPNGFAILGTPECSVAHQRGNMYSPNILTTWTGFGGIDPILGLKKTTIYFLVSTLMPYQVVLAAVDLSMPDRRWTVPIPGGSTILGIRVQLRDLNNRMISSATPTANEPSAAAGGVGGGSTGFFISLADSSAPTRGPAIGDTVTFRNMQNGQLLARNGNRLTYVPTSPVTENAKWTLESTDTTVYPIGTPIRIGRNSTTATPGQTGTPFYVLSVGSGSEARHIKSKPLPEGVRAYSGRGVDAVWTMSWGCLAGDTCTTR
jgi:hypothetical protein